MQTQLELYNTLYNRYRTAYVLWNSRKDKTMNTEGIQKLFLVLELQLQLLLLQPNFVFQNYSFAHLKGNILF